MYNINSTQTIIISLDHLGNLQNINEWLEKQFFKQQTCNIFSEQTLD